MNPQLYWHPYTVFGAERYAVSYGTEWILRRKSSASDGRLCEVNSRCKGHKDEASMREMPMIAPVKAYLTRLRKQHEKRAQQLGSAWEDSGYVVVDDFGAMLRPKRITNSFKDILERKTPPPIRFHDLRHSVATYMLSMGVPIAEISA